tara:strand:+ start:156 stop:668 length:513 start_codon:yes stop_codon:yes gene_type:complete
MAEIIDVIQGIQQAAANSFDGSGKTDTGLRREEPVQITDRKVMDGFGVRMQGDTLIINYHTEMMLKNSKPHQLQNEMNQTFADIVSYLKKEYKSITGDTLELTKLHDEPNIHAEYLNRHRLIVKAVCNYKVGGLSDYSKAAKEDNATPSLDDTVKDFLQKGKPEFIQELM